MPGARSPPPPLELTHDNTQLQPGRFVAPRRAAKPVIVREPGPLKVFWNELYQANWRNAVIAVAGINAIRFLIHATTSFTDGEADKTFHAPKLAHISCAVGVLYLITTVIQVFGVLSALSERLILIRMYAHLSFLAGLLIVVSGFVSGISFFVLSDDLVHECVSLSVIGSLQTQPLFKGKAFKWSNPGPGVAKTHCLAAWSRSSVSQILSVFLFSVFPAIIFFLLAFVYYRQVTDPDHSASLLGRKPKGPNNHANPGSTTSGEVNLRARHQSMPVPAIQLNGTPVDPDFAEGSRGLRRPSGSKSGSSKGKGRGEGKGKERDNGSLVMKTKKRHSLGSTTTPVSDNSIYDISPGPPSYDDATRERGYGYGYQGNLGGGGSESRVELRDGGRLV